MYTDDEKLSLANLGSGAVTELFDTELEKVLKNIIDPNLDAKQTRKITLDIIFKPDGNRDIGAIGVKVSSKLAGSRIFVTKVVFGRDKGGHVEGRELHSGQQGLFDEDNEKVVSLKS